MRKRIKAKYFYIYKTTNLVNGKIYIGQRGSECIPEEDVEYIGSGALFWNAVNKHGWQNFRKEIIEKCLEAELNDREIYWIAFFKSKDKAVGYNLTDGGKATRGYNHKDSTKEKLSKSKIGKPSPRKGIPLLESSKQKISLANKGKVRSESFKKRRAAMMVGVPMQEYVKEKIRKKAIGRKRPDSVKLALREFRSIQVYCKSVLDGSVKTIPCIEDAGVEFSCSATTISNYIKSQLPYKGYLLSKEPFI